MMLKEKILTLLYESNGDDRKGNTDKILKLVKEELLKKLPKESGLERMVRIFISREKAEGYNQALKEVKEIIEKL